MHAAHAVLAVQQQEQLRGSVEPIQAKFGCWDEELLCSLDVVHQAMQQQVQGLREGQLEGWAKHH